MCTIAIFDIFLGCGILNAPTGCTRVFTQQCSYMLLVNNALFDNCHSVKKINKLFYSILSGVAAACNVGY